MGLMDDLNAAILHLSALTGHSGDIHADDTSEVLEQKSDKAELAFIDAEAELEKATFKYQDARKTMMNVRRAVIAIRDDRRRAAIVPEAVD